VQQGERTVLLTERHAQDYVIGRRGTSRDGLELKTNKAMRYDWRKPVGVIRTPPTQV
jgi:hypothetical protein